MCVCVCIHSHTYILPIFIHSFIDGHLYCFHILTVISNPARNIGVHVSFRINVFVFYGGILRSGIAGACVSTVFSFWFLFLTISKLFSIVTSSICFLTGIIWGFSFSTFWLRFVSCIIFDDSHFDTCKVILHFIFWLVFP